MGYPMAAGAQVATKRLGFRVLYEENLREFSFEGTKPLKNAKHGTAQLVFLEL